MQSMTGFGRGEASNEQYKIEIEMKSVNHRYLDINIRLPRALNYLEAFIKNKVKSFAGRGKVDLFIRLEDLQQKAGLVTYNKEVAKAYYNGICQMARDFSLDEKVTAYQLSRFPDVFTVEESAPDEEQLTQLLERALEQAGEMFLESRKTEGENLARDITDKLASISQVVDQIAGRSPQIVSEYRERIIEKVNELLGDNHVEEGVLANELIIYADKVCVDEEMVRLKTHVAHMKETLLTEGSIGRKLDFLTQEMNREANTILSKANDSTVSEFGIELKTEIEKIREQIQNIE